jgi:hypothetical protein
MKDSSLFLLLRSLRILLPLMILCPLEDVLSRKTPARPGKTPYPAVSFLFLLPSSSRHTVAQNFRGREISLGAPVSLDLVAVGWVRAPAHGFLSRPRFQS